MATKDLSSCGPYAGAYLKIEQERIQLGVIDLYDHQYGAHPGYHYGASAKMGALI
ncbi:hypothetical protein [Mycetohabitans endofungorum]|uniref:hypothetical protein n=1 Tax=Mycetohabitans endofungorum TaxID=417203 RepID=UPI002B057E63|nr:hypothetical protein [Mycetohabitans endofungorum]